MTDRQVGASCFTIATAPNAIEPLHHPIEALAIDPGPFGEGVPSQHRALP